MKKVQVTRAATTVWLLAGMCFPNLEGAESAPPRVSLAEGQRILEAMLEANRYWLLGPPPAVTNYAYTYHLGGSEPSPVVVTNPRAATSAQRQGTTYFSWLHALASKTSRAEVTELMEDAGRMTLSVSMTPAVKGHCGNGLDGSWRGYFNLGGERAQVVIETARFVPIRASLGQLDELFGDFAPVDKTHYVPLTVTVQKPEKMRFDWRFRLHEPGFWLLDYSEYGSNRVAWTERVEVNSRSARLKQATETSLARAKAESEGALRLREFLAANRHWLLPSLDARRGLVYDYRQEAPYWERVRFDPNGNLMVRLEANKDQPASPSRQRLWLADGSWLDADEQDAYVRLNPPPTTALGANGALLPQDRQAQHLAMGLAWECALTRLGREPGSFWAEVKPATHASEYELVLRPKKDARLFVGTMLMFTSWAYMHDVRYTHSVVRCDAATHRPLEEKDFEDKELRGQFWFDGYQESPTGTVPGRIRALVPYLKNDQDNSLEMEAQFHLVRGGLWLLDRVQSAFRGGGGGSTGVVQLVEAGPEMFVPIQNLTAKLQRTRDVIALVEASPKGGAEVELPLDEWRTVAFQPTWTDKARESLKWKDEDRVSNPQSVVGVHRARAVRQSDGSVQIELEGITTVSWKEFETEWKAAWIEQEGAKPTELSASLPVKCLGGPTPVVVQFQSARIPAVAAGPLKLKLEGTVRRLSGAYHGHGMWFRLSD